jgi:hypothetical protein
MTSGAAKFGDAAFGWLDARLFGPEPELLAQRGLNAVAVEDFAFDLGGLDGFVADELDFERLLVVRVDVPACTDELARPQQELLFQRL